MPHSPSLPLLPLLLLLLFLFPPPTTALIAPAGAHVQEVTDEEFGALDRSQPFLLEFYSQYCGHCIAYAPTYETVGDLLQGAFRVARLSIIDFNEVGKAQNVHGVPHLGLFVPGHGEVLRKINAERQPRDVIDVVMKMSELSNQGLTSIDEVVAFMPTEAAIYPSRHLLLYNGEEVKGTTEYLSFAEQNGDVSFFASFDVSGSEVEVEKLFGKMSFPSVLSRVVSESGDQNAGKLAVMALDAFRKANPIQVQEEEGPFDVAASSSFSTLSNINKLKSSPSSTTTTPSLLSPVSFLAAMDTVAVAGMAGALSILSLCVCVCWYSRNRNLPLKQAIPVDLNSVTWELGKRAKD